MAEIKALAISDVLQITPKKFEDERGFFSETYNKKILSEAGFDKEFVQDNQSLSVEKGVLRGLHYQEPPFAQDKLIRVLRGAIYDVAVDMRTGSQSFGQHVGAVLSEENWSQLLVPIGFAHGFLTLEPNTIVHYKVTNFYSKECDRGISWNDPNLNIAWPDIGSNPILSQKDQNLPRLDEIQSPFEVA